MKKVIFLFLMVTAVLTLSACACSTDVTDSPPEATFEYDLPATTTETATELEDTDEVETVETQPTEPYVEDDPLPDENEQTNQNQENQAIVVWKVEPIFDYERIRYCPWCEVFSAGDPLYIVDETTGALTDEIKFGHGGSSSRYLYDQALDIFGLYRSGPGWNEIVIYTRAEFLSEFGDHLQGRVNFFYAMDSTIIKTEEMPWGPFYNIDEVLTGKGAVSFGIDFITDFIFNSVEGNRTWNRHKNSIIAVQQNEKWGIVNYEGNIIIPIEFEHILIIDPDTAFARQNGRYGIIFIPQH